MFLVASPAELTLLIYYDISSVVLTYSLSFGVPSNIGSFFLRGQVDGKTTLCANNACKPINIIKSVNVLHFLGNFRYFKFLQVGISFSISYLF